MTEHDRQNLNFLLTASQKTLKLWYDTVSEDDKQYAYELLDTYRKELKIKVALFEDEVTDTTQANILLENIFRLDR